MKKLILASILSLSLLTHPLSASAATDVESLEKQIHKLQQKVLSLESEVNTLKQKNAELYTWYTSLKPFLEIKTGTSPDSGEQKTFLSINAPMIWNATLEGLTSFRKDENGYSDLKSFYNLFQLLSDKVQNMSSEA